MLRPIWRFVFLSTLFALNLPGQIDTALKPSASFVPQTSRQRTSQYLKDAFNPLYVFTSSASAGIGLWRDAPPEWKQGGRGFGLRFGSSYAQHLTSETLLFGAGSLLHEDNRYVPSPRGTFKARLAWAIKGAFLARRDDGTSRVSASRLGAMAWASLISRAWQPPSNSSLHSAGVNFGVSIAAAVGFKVAAEFSPAWWHLR